MKGAQRATETAQGGEVVSFTVGLPPRALRRNSLTASYGWRAKLVREYQEAVWIAGQGAKFTMSRVVIPPERTTDGSQLVAKVTAPLPIDFRPWEQARLSLVWCHAGVAPDADNALASLKPLIDVLHTRSQRPLGIVVDDSPAHLAIMPVELRKVRHRADERVEITIECVQEAE